MSVKAAVPPDVWVSRGPLATIRVTFSRIITFCLVELQKLSHDRTELFTRAIQPILWLGIFGTTFSRVRAIPTGDVSYLAFMSPGVIAQSGMFVAIFYGIQIIWERDAGILAKLLVTPTPRVALAAGKAFAAGIRSVAIALVVIAFALIIRVDLTLNPLKWLAACGVVVLGSAFFCCLSLCIAGLVLHRDRLMGIGQAITMPLFFASNALYPIEMMPSWVQVLARVNPMSYEVSMLRGLLLGQPTNYLADLTVLIVAGVVGIAVASSLMGRLSR